MQAGVFSYGVWVGGFEGWHDDRKQVFARFCPYVVVRVSREVFKSTSAAKCEAHVRWQDVLQLQVPSQRGSLVFEVRARVGDQLRTDEYVGEASCNMQDLVRGLLNDIELPLRFQGEPRQRTLRVRIFSAQCGGDSRLPSDNRFTPGQSHHHLVTIERLLSTDPTSPTPTLEQFLHFESAGLPPGPLPKPETGGALSSAPISESCHTIRFIIRHRKNLFPITTPAGAPGSIAGRGGEGDVPGGVSFGVCWNNVNLSTPLKDFGVRYSDVDHTMTYLNTALGDSVSLWKRPLGDGETLTLYIKEDDTLEVARGGRKLDFMNSGKVPIPWRKNEMHFAVQFNSTTYWVEVDRKFLLGRTNPAWAFPRADGTADAQKLRNPNPKKSNNSFHHPTTSPYVGFTLPAPDASGVLVEDEELKETFDRVSRGKEWIGVQHFTEYINSLESFGLTPRGDEVSRFRRDFRRAAMDDKITFDEFAVLMLRRAQQ